MRNRLPCWFKQEIPDESTWTMMRMLLEFGVHTVCQEANCPNITYCFKDKRITFMLLGNVCTRNCKFCNVKKTGTVFPAPPQPSLEEGYRISELVKRLDLDYVVITSVSRDDLADGGAAVFAKTVELIHGINKNINPVRDTANSSNNSKVSNGVKIEVLIPDFQGNVSSLERILDAHPFIVAHNIETVRRLYADLRPMADYEQSLNVLGKIKELKPEIITKSSLMLGLGEKEEEVIAAIKDLRQSNCDILTLGQYLAPSSEHYPVKEFINIEQFAMYREAALNLGFKSVLSGPLVRSSYQAEDRR